MSKEKPLEGDYGFFKVRREDNILVTNFEKNLLLRSADLKSKEIFFNFLDRVDESDSVNVMVMVSAPDKAGQDEYVELVERLVDSRFGRDDLMRIFNAINQYILRIRELKKFVVHATSGPVIMTFLNISMAYDYRLVAEGTVFQNPCLEIGLAPKGGGPYFLSKMLGVKTAYDVLLSCYDFSAKEALRLGLVNKVVPFDRLEHEAVLVARHFAEHPAWTIAGIKSMVNFTMRDLAEYLELENRELVKIIDSGRFRRARSKGLFEARDDGLRPLASV